MDGPLVLYGLKGFHDGLLPAPEVDDRGFEGIVIDGSLCLQAVGAVGFGGGLIPC